MKFSMTGQEIGDLLIRVLTHRGKWEILWNFVLHVPSREMSLKI